MGTTGLLLLVLAPAIFAGSQCPEDSVSCAGNGFAPSDPVFSHSCSAPTYTASAGYNIPAGTLTATQGGIGSTSVSMNDDYIFIGPVPGASITCTARLNITGMTQVNHQPTCRTILWASLNMTTGGAVGRSVTCVGAPAIIDEFLLLPVEHPAGEPFRLQAKLEALVYVNGSDYVTILGTLSFTDLPPDVTVVSCNGYQQGTPLAVHPTTWGYVKTLYR
jgi:hypothetical protein